jgi:protein SCO1
MMNKVSQFASIRLQHSMKGMFAAMACLFAMSLCMADFVSGASPQSAALPSDSIYQLPVKMRDHEGHALSMSAMQGQVQVVTMIYTSCAYVCPMTIENIKSLRAELTPAQREQLHTLLISLDPERDTVKVLKKTMAERHLDGRHWTMARPEMADVRRVAAVLGIQYRQLSNKEFNHSTVLILLDAEGRIRARTTKLDEVDRDFVAAVKTVLGEALGAKKGQG